MSAKRAASEGPSEPEEGQIEDRPAKMSRLEGQIEDLPAKMSRLEDPPSANDTNGNDSAEPAATPLPISNPFQARFHAAELGAGQYHVLDEAGSEDEAEENSGDSDSDMDEDELMEMLDADLPAKFKGTRRVRGRGGPEDPDDDSGYEQRDKTVLTERGRNPVEPLPEGWVQVTHMSGMPVFLHRQSRVVTITRPYFLGPGSLRKHDIPLHSVPCLQYLRELQKESAEKGGGEPASCPVSGGQSGCPAAGATKTAVNGDSTAEPGSGGAEAADSGETATSNGDSAVDETPAESAAQSPAESNTEVAESAAQSPAETDTAVAAPAESVAESSAETDTAAESAVQSPAETDTAAESAVQSPAETDTAAESAVQSPAETDTAAESAVQSPAETDTAAESAVQSPAETDTAAESAVQSPAETDTAAATPAESAVQSPAESTTAAADESPSVAPTPAESAAQSPSEPAANGEKPDQPTTNGVAGPTGGPTPVEGTSMVVKDPSITPEELNEYCSTRFQFKTIRLMKFTTWRERRQYLRKKRTQRPQMSSKTKLLSFPVQPSRNSAAVPGTRLREWVLNPGGKSYVCILHEYLQHVLREQPVYSYSELENAATPYGATVSVQSVQYGSGYGSSKKQAKSEAAKATLQIFLPNLMEQIDSDKTVRGSTKPADMDLSFFDSIRLEDPRVADLCSKAAEPSPYTILLICLQRNFGLTGNQVTCKLHTNKHQHNEFEMTVGKHTARVPCKNKKDGKHLAAQSLLQQLHPHVTSWGSLLRMYGNHSSKSLKVKRQEEQQITLLQSKATVNSPNYAILDKLREEMSKLQEVRRQVQPIGFLQLTGHHEDAVQGRSESGVTLDVVDL